MQYFAKIVSLAALLALADSGVVMAASQPEMQRDRNVELFDQLLNCSSKPEFAIYGLGAGGSCADWVRDIEAERQNDRSLILGGFECLAGDIRIAGNSLVRGDKDHFSFVNSLVDECRVAAGS